jgi:CO/xanthine dehydrogenase FAD-binding subunit
LKIDSYRKVGSVEEAYDLLVGQPGASVIAGGAWLKLMPKNIGTAIDLSGIGLDSIEETEDEFVIGSMVTLRQLETFEPFSTLYDGILVKSAGSIMGVTVRNIATIGGTVSGKYGFSDLIPALTATDAILEFHIKGSVKLVDFMNEASSEKDILTRIHIKKPGGRGWFHTLKNTAIDFPVLNAAVTKTGNGCIIVVGARPYKAAAAVKAMEYINGCKSVGESEMEKAAEIAAGELKFGKNQRGSAKYRKELCRTFVKRGLMEVMS